MLNLMDTMTIRLHDIAILYTCDTVAMLQAQAEETLNTLHFASMALRVKCNPLCILDPQDKLVLNLRGTITKLKQENQQLSTALQRSRSNSNEGSRESAPEAQANYQVSVTQKLALWVRMVARH